MVQVYSFLMVQFKPSKAFRVLREADGLFNLHTLFCKYNFFSVRMLSQLMVVLPGQGACCCSTNRTFQSPLKTVKGQHGMVERAYGNLCFSFRICYIDYLIGNLICLL